MAFHAIREKLGRDPPDDERGHLEEQLDEVRELLVRRRDITKRQRKTQHENKKAARLKRMGGLPPLPQAYQTRQAPVEEVKPPPGDLPRPAPFLSAESRLRQTDAASVLRPSAAENTWSVRILNGFKPLIPNYYLDI